MNHNTADGPARWTLILTLAGLLVAVAAAVGTWYGVLQPSTVPVEAGSASVGTGIATVGEQRIGGDLTITGTDSAVAPVPASSSDSARAAAGVGISNIGKQQIKGSVIIDGTQGPTTP
jgi:hypothetical protein